MMPTDILCDTAVVVVAATGGRMPVTTPDDLSNPPWGPTIGSQAQNLPNPSDNREPRATKMRRRGRGGAKATTTTTGRQRRQIKQRARQEPPNDRGSESAVQEKRHTREKDRPVGSRNWRHEARKTPQTRHRTSSGKQHRRMTAKNLLTHATPDLSR